jgi:hypothetical protein
MATLDIRDLPDNQELDHKAMATVRGGLSLGRQGETQAAVTTADSDAGSASKAKPQDFHFVHYYDKASPVIGL